MPVEGPAAPGRKLPRETPLSDASYLANPNKYNSFGGDSIFGIGTLPTSMKPSRGSRKRNMIVQDHGVAGLLIESTILLVQNQFRDAFHGVSQAAINCQHPIPHVPPSAQSEHRIDFVHW